MNIIVPGLHNSDAQHWQTFIEKLDPVNSKRILQENWDEPNNDVWIRKIEDDLLHCRKADLILIGHSIGCIAIIKWLEKYQHQVKGVLLVAPSDSENPNYPKYISGFTPIPIEQLSCPSIVVASNNDHVTELNRSKHFAKSWGSELEILENAGHIESKSGFGEWPFVFELIQRLNNS